MRSGRNEIGLDPSQELHTGQVRRESYSDGHRIHAGTDNGVDNRDVDLAPGDEVTEDDIG